MKFSDITLSDEDMAEIERKIEEYNTNVYRGTMEPRTKRLLRQKLVREMKEGIWADRDYSPADEGEAPKGAQW